MSYYYFKFCYVVSTVLAEPAGIYSLALAVLAMIFVAMRNQVARRFRRAV